MPSSLTWPIIPVAADVADTAEDIINTVAVQVGLEEFSDPYTSTDGNAIQLVSLFKSFGRRLWRERTWTILTREHTFTTAAATQNYALPADFGRMLDQTGWNRTSRMPLGGPLSPQTWQYLEGFGAALTVTVLFRPLIGELYLGPTDPPTGQEIVFEYLSKYWVQSSSGTAPDKTKPTASDDTLVFDSELLVCGLKLSWLKAKGFDTTSAQDDYTRLLSLVMADDGSAGVLSIAPGDNSNLLTLDNLPEGSIG